MPANNFVIGRGRVYLARLDSVSKEPGPFRYVGQTPELNMNITTEDYIHYSSDGGIRQEDRRVPLSITYASTLTMRDQDMRNVALFFLGNLSDGAQAAASNQTDVISGARLTHILSEGFDADNEIIVGVKASDPVGARKLSADPTLAGMNSADPAAAVSLVKGTDWKVVDNDRAAIQLLKTAKTYDATGTAILSRITVTYARAAISDVQKIVSGGKEFEGAIRFEEDNPQGDNNIYVFPQVIITPNGDLNFKAEEWRDIPLSMAVNKPANAEAVYINGVAA